MTSNSSSVVLTLSGGGFRATLFHLGVVRFLYDAGLLQRVRRIHSVSGGSVLAAHLVLNWDRYTSKHAADFDKVAGALISFAQKDVRGSIVRHLICRVLAVALSIIAGLALFHWYPYWTVLAVWAATCVLLALVEVKKGGRTRLLERQYGALYDRKLLRDLGMRDGPEVNLLTTSLTTGRLLAFTKTGLTWQDPTSAAGEPLNTDTLPVAKAVAASSAFPPFFPPVQLTWRDLKCSEEQFPTAQRLTDGGVYDNLGLDWLSGKSGPEVAALSEQLIVSDAQGAFDWSVDSSFQLALPRNVRATNILMKRVSDFEYHLVEAGLGPRVRPCWIGSKVDCRQGYYSTSPATQRELQQIRTDFDEFTNLEVHLLVSHGYAVARQVCLDLPAGPLPAACQTEPWLCVPTDQGLNIARTGELDLTSSKRRGWGLWRAREAVSVLNVALLLLCLVLPLCLLLARLLPSWCERELPVSVAAIGSFQDPLIRENLWLVPVVDLLQQEGGKAKASGRIADFQVVSIRINRTGEPPGTVYGSRRCRLTCKSQDYSCVGYAFSLLADPTGRRCESLRRQDPESGETWWTLPDTAFDDPFVLIGRIEKQKGGPIDADLSDLFTIKVK